jgi:hypothetical protein
MRFACLLLTSILLSPAAAAQQDVPWQQEVTYEMDVVLHANRHRLVGAQRLTYVNNSPDTLDRVFYHLYFNAFHPRSLMAERNRHLPDPDTRVVPRIFQLGPDEVGFQRVYTLHQDGLPVTWRVHDTVMEVRLARPILPGGTSVFEMAFEAQVPLQTRRSGRDNSEGIRFSMAQWYPKMAAYDGLGWHPHPYIGREFYGPFGTFDVRITLPAEYVIGATGVLQNPGEIGHGYEQPADAGRVATGPARRADGSRPDSLTWHFRAERVHDFAWGADPEFIHERHLVTGVHGRDEPVEIHLFFRPNVANRWQQLGEWTSAMVRFYSERYGSYGYPQFTVIQGGDGGMEYPMLTFITGRRSPESLFSVTAHELAHMWFYGMVATNETLFSWLDEGIANYATHEARHHLFAGRRDRADHTHAIESVAHAQREGIFVRPNKPADWYETNTSFGLAAYTGGQAFISLLGYVMGDDALDRFLYRFGTEYRWRHPYPADVQNLAQRVSGMHLNWLFDQFLNGAERYDYAATRLEVNEADGRYRTAVTLERRERGVLPVDLVVRFADGSAQWIHVPLAEAHGHKAVPADWVVADPWPWVHPTYTFTLESDRRPVEVIVDPAGRTPDIRRTNNRVSADRRGRNRAS